MEPLKNLELMMQTQPPSTAKTIVAIDDHEMILSGIANLLRQKHPEATVEVAQTRRAGERNCQNWVLDLRAEAPT
jgi:DNA-binding NarL/FixJ family response regulator